MENPKEKVQCPFCPKLIQRDVLRSHVKRYPETHRDLREGEIEGVDYVRCVVCDYTHAQSLVYHLNNSHGLTDSAYTEQYGVSASVDVSNYKPKRVTCPFCNENLSERALAYHFESRLATHPPFLVWNNEIRYKDLAEGVDYVRCQICGWLAPSLMTHIKSTHKLDVKVYKTQYGTSVICETKRKTQGDQLKKSRSTWEDVYFTCKCGKRCRGRHIAIKDQDLRCRKCKDAEKQQRKFDGKIEGSDYVKCLECDYKGVSLNSHLNKCHDGYRERHPQFQLRAECFETGEILLTKAQLEPFLDQNRKVIQAKAAEFLKLDVHTIRRNCRILGLKISGAPVRQYQFLDVLREILGITYKPEWSDTRFRNPKTAYKYRFDGYFKLSEGIEIIVEFMGHQHYIHPSRYINDFDKFLDLQRKDDHKKELVLAHGYRYLSVKESEAFLDKTFLISKLREIGIEIPETVDP